MSTTNHAFFRNTAATSVANSFNLIWTMTRALMKAGWKVKGSSDGTTKTTSLDPALCEWNSAANVGSVTNVGAGAAVVAAPSRGRAVVTGLTGIVAADKGRFLKMSGSAVGANNNSHQIEEVLSATSVAIDARTFAVGADAVGRTWEIRDAQSDTYPSGTLAAVSAWLLLQGPSTMLIPTTVNPTGFTKGEVVTQATTGAKGEYLGKYWNGSAGWLAVMPHVRGSGAPTTVQGWATGNNITGATSGAVVAQNGTAKEFVNEIVFWKANNESTGSIFWGHFDTATDSAEMFSALVAAAGCTATVAPGGGGTGNAFPAHGVVVHGSATTGTHQNWFRTTADLANGLGVAYDCIPEDGYTADGSFAFGCYGAAANSAFHLHALWYCDGTEGANACPYAWNRPPSNGGLYGNTRTGVAVLSSVLTTGNASLGCHATFGATATMLCGWRRRGLSGENFTDAEVCADVPPNTGASTFHWSGVGLIKRQHSDDDYDFVLDSVRVGVFGGTNRFVIGRPKWLRVSPYGQMCQLLLDEGSQYWINLQTGSATSSQCPFAIAWPDSTNANAY